MLRDKNFAYLNFDNHSLLDAWDADLVMRMLDDVYPGYEYILLDEVQNLDAWDLWVSELYRRGKNLVITGSNARMLSSEMATVLTGKYLQVEMLPFSLEEFFDWNKLDLHSVNAEQQTERGNMMEKYLENYPLVLSVDEVADILGVTGKTIRHLIKAGDLGSIKVGRLIRIPKDRLVEYLGRQDRKEHRYEE
jgi:excisionase family DNA binding protein